jgi:DNA-binding NarL/FixJ family response regulator
MTIDTLQHRATSLTEREATILALFGAGLTMKEVGAECGIVTGTAKCHIENIPRKLGSMFFYVCGAAR